MEGGATRKTKKRSLKELPAAVRAEIVQLHEVEHMHQKDIAERFRVSSTLVGRLVKESVSQPEKQEQLVAKKQQEKQAREAIKAAVEEMLEGSVPIQKADMIVLRVNEHTDLEVRHEEVRSVLRNDLGLGYRIAKKVPIQSNSERCLVLRQQYALAMLGLLEQGKRIINVDESWLNESSFLRKIWCPGYSPATVTTHAVNPRISLIAAVDTDGRIWYSCSQANTDQKVMLAFLRRLALHLDDETPGWRSDSYVLMDGAKYHTGEEVREYIHKMQLPVIWSAPYSYATAPIELLFGGLKFGELNPQRLPTGKKVSA